MDASFFKVDQQKRNRGRRDAGDARGHAQSFGSLLLQLLPGLYGQGRHLQIIQVGGQPQALKVHRPAHLFLLPVDVSGIFGCYFHLLHHRRIQVAQVFLERFAPSCFT